jgi:RNA polymerase sigma factor (sigma-70 family)
MTNYTHCEEHELLYHLASGEEQAFTVIYNRYWKPMFFIAHKKLQSVEDAKEIVQGVFFTLWQKRDTLVINDLSVYLAAMTRYAVYRHLAKEKKRKDQLKKIEKDAKPVAVFDVENKQLLELLNRFTSKLPEKYRIIFLYHKLMDRPLEEVAGQLGVSPRTAEGYVSKVMALMRQHHKKVAFSLFL